MGREKIIQVAKSHLGVGENATNSNRTIYGKWYGLDDFPRCAMLVSWVYNHAGTSLGHVGDDKGYRDCNSAFCKSKASNESSKTSVRTSATTVSMVGTETRRHTQ
jgi:hypothetical protein